MLKIKDEPKPQNTIFKKIWIIIVCNLIFLIPLGLTKSLISERDGYRLEAQQKIEKSWAGIQNINPPLLQVGDSDFQESLALKEYSVKANMYIETRKKGIFKIPVYTADVEQSGYFLAKKQLPRYISTTLSLTATDPRGYIETPVLKIGKNQEFHPFISGEEHIDIGGMTKIPFVIKYKLRGINNLNVKPSGQNTSVNISGNWTNPEFGGDFLPVKKTMDKNGFSAEWNIPESAAMALIENPVCGVSLLLPVDNYKLAYKAVKYGFLFISLTFLCLFLFEILSKQRIHPVQYIMVGLVMCMFYLLLLSMSEFINFGVSYFVSAVSIITIITIYAQNVLTKHRALKFTLLLSGMLLFLYFFLYILLRLQDFSLIVGSFGTLFIIMLTMYVTRNVEWYKSEEITENTPQ